MSHWQEQLKCAEKTTWQWVKKWVGRKRVKTIIPALHCKELSTSLGLSPIFSSKFYIFTRWVVCPVISVKCETRWSFRNFGWEGKERGREREIVLRGFFLGWRDLSVFINLEQWFSSPQHTRSTWGALKMTESLRPIPRKSVCVTQVILMWGWGWGEDPSKGKAQVSKERRVVQGMTD